MKMKSLIMFLTGLSLGGFTGYFLGWALDDTKGSSSKASLDDIYNNYIKKPFADKINKKGIYEKMTDSGSKDTTDDIDISEPYCLLNRDSDNSANVSMEENNEAANNSIDQDNAGTSTDRSGSEVDREQHESSIPSEVREYSPTADAVSDALVNVISSEDDLGVPDKDPYVTVISAREFVVAVASGCLMRSFIFNPSDNAFYWNFTEEDVDKTEAVSWFGSDVIDDILKECSETGTIQPKFLYNATEDIYMKIEPGVVINK